MVKLEKKKEGFFGENRLLDYSKGVLTCVVLFYVYVILDLLGGMGFTIFFGGLTFLLLLFYLVSLIVGVIKGRGKEYILKPLKLLKISGWLLLLLIVAVLVLVRFL